MSDFESMLRGYGLTIAHIAYRLPDHPLILQEYLWQDYDLAPKFPGLNAFLGWWEDNIEGRLHSVRVANALLIRPAEVKLVRNRLNLH